MKFFLKPILGITILFLAGCLSQEDAERHIVGSWLGKGDQLEWCVTYRDDSLLTMTYIAAWHGVDGGYVRITEQVGRWHLGRGKRLVYRLANRYDKSGAEIATEDRRFVTVRNQIATVDEDDFVYESEKGKRFTANRVQGCSPALFQQS